MSSHSSTSASDEESIEQDILLLHNDFNEICEPEKEEIINLEIEQQENNEPFYDNNIETSNNNNESSNNNNGSSNNVNYIENKEEHSIKSIFDRLGQSPKKSNSGGGFFGMIDKVLFGSSPVTSPQEEPHKHRQISSPASETIGEISKGILSLGLRGLELVGNNTSQFVKGASYDANNSNPNDNTVYNPNCSLEAIIKEYSGYHALEKIQLKGSKAARNLKISLKERQGYSDILEMLNDKSSFITKHLSSPVTISDNDDHNGDGDDDAFKEWKKLESGWEFRYIPLIQENQFEFASKLLNTIDESHNSLNTGSSRLKFSELVTPIERKNYVHLYSLGRMISASLFLLDIIEYSMENMNLFNDFHSLIYSLFSSSIVKDVERDLIYDILNDAFMALIPLIKLQYL